MMRSILNFFSMLAFGVMTLALIATLLPSFEGHAPAAFWPVGTSLQLESASLGLSLGLFLGIVSRYHWGDIPRRMINWVLIRERQFFYYALIVGCLGVLVFY